MALPLEGVSSCCSFLFVPYAICHHDFRDVRRVLAVIGLSCSNLRLPDLVSRCLCGRPIRQMSIPEDEEGRQQKSFQHCSCGPMSLELQEKTCRTSSRQVETTCSVHAKDEELMRVVRISTIIFIAEAGKRTFAQRLLAPEEGAVV